MSETEEKKGKSRLSLSRPGSLELKKIVESGQVRQSFSHGRSKAVTVEVRKKRSFARDDAGKMKEVTGEAVAERAPVKAPAPAKAPAPLRSSGRTLTEEERAARLRALEDARHTGGDIDVDDGLDDVGRARAQVEVEDAAAAARRAEAEEILRAAEAEEAARQALERKAQVEKAAPAPAVPDVDPVGPDEAKVRDRKVDEREAGDDAQRGRRPVGAKPVRPAAPVRREAPRRRTGKLTIAQALDGDDSRMRSLASMRRARERERKQTLKDGDAVGKVIRDVVVPETITVQELANRMAERGGEVIKALMKIGVMATITESIDSETAELIATEFGHRVKRVSAADVEIGLKGAADADVDLVARAPVVTVMGHVDHGKTSLLDALRKTDVAGREAGGITQHIGAYQVRLPSDKVITFLDTPGHEAFTAMRARGAQATDIVVLVVAADDSIMPQTVEAIHHAKAASVPIVVAINKIDKPAADPGKVRTELLQHEIIPEEMGGDVLVVEVSAKNGLNLDKLEEAILLQSEVLELKANPNRAAEGVVIEAKVERGRGSVATVLVQRGTLRVGDLFVAGAEWGRVRALIDDRGAKVDSAGPSMPVEVLGLSSTPSAGDDFAVVGSETQAREISEFRRNQVRDAAAISGARGTMEQLMMAAADAVKEVPVVIKGDVQGSVEAIVGSLGKFKTDEVKVRVLHAAVGGINESDVTLAKASNALIIGFNVRANPQAREMAKTENVNIRYYSVIYDVTDDVKAMVTGMLSPILRETFLGNVQVREVFAVSKVGKVAGCMVTEGVVRRGAKVRLLRDNVVIHEGQLSTLKRFKDEVREVKDGYECGMALLNYQDIKVGDVIECFDVEEIARTL